MKAFFAKVIAVLLLLSGSLWGSKPEIAEPLVVVPVKEPTIKTETDTGYTGGHQDPANTIILPGETFSPQSIPTEPVLSAVPDTATEPAASWQIAPEPTPVQCEQSTTPVVGVRDDQPSPAVSEVGPEVSDTLPTESGVYYEATVPTEDTPVQIIETQPAPTEHTHNWQTTNYPETGHNVDYYCCACGYVLASPGDYDAHVASYTGTAEMFTVHGHWGTGSQWVVDVPAYTEWYCTGCGAVSSSQP